MPLLARLEIMRSRRLDIGRPATLRSSDGLPMDVEVRNLSETGCLISSTVPLPLGSELSLGIPGLGRRRARVSRADHPQYGCAFELPVSPHQLAAALSVSSLVHGDFGAVPSAAPVSDRPKRQSPRRLRFRTRLAVIVGVSILLWGMLAVAVMLALQ